MLVRPGSSQVGMSFSQAKNHEIESGISYLTKVKRKPVDFVVKDSKADILFSVSFVVSPAIFWIVVLVSFLP